MPWFEFNFYSMQKAIDRPVAGRVMRQWVYLLSSFYQIINLYNVEKPLYLI